MRSDRLLPSKGAQGEDCKVNHGFERTFASSEATNRKQNYNHAPECFEHDFTIDNIT